MSDFARVSEVPNEFWTGIIEQANGAVVQVSGKLDSWKLKQIYYLVKSSTLALPDDIVKKITISFESNQYVVLFDDSFIYVSHKETSTDT